MQKPTIGRVVHVSFSGQRLLGQVTYVHSDTCINCAVFDTSGNPMPGMTSLLHAEEPSPSPNPNVTSAPHMTWSWPPR